MPKIRKVEKEKILVIGAGSWGTTLAHYLTTQKRNVTLWGRDQELLKEIESFKKNEKYLHGHTLHQNLQIQKDLSEGVKESSILVLSVPAQQTRMICEQVKNDIAPGTLIISTAKGVERSTLLLLTEVIQEILSIEFPIVALSGPSFAKEVIQGLPTAVTFASQKISDAKRAANLFHSEKFQAFLSKDIKCVELAGAIKNVLAIAVGVVDGKGLGLNARAALITRGLAELQKLISAAGGNPRTVSGLSGLGDLLLTATGDLSRNRRVGLEVGRGKSVKEALEEIGQVAEGVLTAPILVEYARRHSVSLPITTAVARVLAGEVSVDEAIDNLLLRSISKEF
jgi:glycerol-3-phosphate dehydrogenase (NAD(P)+)